MNLTTYYNLTERDKELLTERYRSSHYPCLSDETAIAHYQRIRAAFEEGAPGNDEISAVAKVREEFVKNLDALDKESVSRLMYQFLFKGEMDEEMKKMMHDALERVMSVKTPDEIKAEEMEKKLREKKEQRSQIAKKAQLVQSNRQLFDIDGNFAFAVGTSGKLYTNCTMDKYDKLKYWSGFVGVAVKKNCVAGLKSDGKVVLFENGMPMLGNKWSNIRQIIAAGNNFFGLKNDGTVVSTGESVCTEWNNVTLLQVGHGGCVGITSDGKILSEGLPYNEYKDAIAVSGDYVLRKNGIVVKDSAKKEIWSGIIALCAVDTGIDSEVVFIKYDRTLISPSKKINNYLSKITDAVAIASERDLLYVATSDGSLCSIGARGKMKDMGWQIPVVV